MTNPLFTTSEIQSGNLLVTVDGAEYRAVTAIYKLNGNGAATFYCSGADWAETPPTIHARYQAEIARLLAENVRLAESLLAITSPSVMPEPPAAHDIEPSVEQTTEPPIQFFCPHCPETFKNRAGLAAHTRFNHS